MTWGEPQGLARFHPATMAYGGAHGYEEEKRALEASLEAGINLVDTAAFYSAEPRKRAGELAQGIDVLIATNSRPGSGFESTTSARVGGEPEQAGTPQPRPLPASFPGTSFDTGFDEPHGRRCRGREGDSGRSQQLLGGTDAAGPRRSRSPRVPLAANQVEYSLLHRQPETNGVLDACRELGVTSSRTPHSPGEC